MKQNQHEGGEEGQEPNSDNAGSQMTRRTFVKCGAMSSAGALLAGASDWLRPAVPTRIGILGLGAVGQAHWQAALMAKTVHIGALCDLAFSQRKSAWGLWQKDQAAMVPGTAAPVLYENHEHLLANSLFQTPLDLIVIGTPNEVHLNHALAAMRAGKVVLLESLPVCTPDEFRILDEEVKRSRGVVKISTPWRMTRGARQAQAWMQNGVIGRLQDVQIVCTGWSLSYATQGKNRWQWEAKGNFRDTLFSGVGFSLIDLFFWITEQRAAGLAFSYGHIESSGMKPGGTKSLIAGVRFDTGVGLSLQYRMGSGVNPTSSLILRGTEGMISLDSRGAVACQRKSVLLPMPSRTPGVQKSSLRNLWKNWPNVYAEANLLASIHSCHPALTTVFSILRSRDVGGMTRLS